MKTERRRGEKAGGIGLKAEIRGKRAETYRPSRERRHSEYVTGGGQGDWPAMHSWGWARQSSKSCLARRNKAGPIGG
jgi:hypothetical protein